MLRTPQITAKVRANSIVSFDDNGTSDYCTSDRMYEIAPR
jgi:hypothetical protein